MQGIIDYFEYVIDYFVLKNVLGKLKNIVLDYHNQ